MKIKILLAALFVALLSPTETQAQAENALLGQVIMFAGNYAPEGWALCQGQMLPISQNSALFSLLGTTYGGDGRTIFGLPDLRGRAPIGAGTGPGLTPMTQGYRGGSENVTLTGLQMPDHNHVGGTSKTSTVYTMSEAGTGTTNTTVVTPGGYTGNTGGGLGFSVRDPYLGMNYIICVTGGIYPSKN